MKISEAVADYAVDEMKISHYQEENALNGGDE